MGNAVKKLKGQFSTPDKREQWAWCVYDLAKSPFESVLNVFIGPYITYLAQKQACLTRSTDCGWCDEADQCLSNYLPSNHSILTTCWKDACDDDDLPECCTTSDYVDFGSTEIAYSAFFAFAVAGSVICQIVLLPFFGAIGDQYNPKKFLVTSTAVASASLIAILGTNQPHLYWVAALLYIITNIAYGVSSVFYNASLIYIAYPDERDTIGAHGFAVGYTGAVIYLIICFILYLSNDSHTMTTFIIALTGIWWISWAIIPFLFVHSTVPKDQVGQTDQSPEKAKRGKGISIFALALKKLAAAVAILKRLPHTGLFLIAASIYNDGISTIGSMASVFATETVDASSTDLLVAFLAMNITAIIGAIFFNQVRKWLDSSKLAIVIGIVVFMVLVIYAYFIKRTWEVYIIGVIVGFALGGTQSLSRSLLAVIIPKNYESEIFSFYEITQRGTSWIGPIVYGGFVTAYDNDHRPAMMSMLIFLAIGGVLLMFVDVNKAAETAANISEGGQDLPPRSPPYRLSNSSAGLVS